MFNKRNLSIFAMIVFCAVMSNASAPADEKEKAEELTYREIVPGVRNIYKEGKVVKQELLDPQKNNNEQFAIADIHWLRFRSKDSFRSLALKTD